jgi:hypothetical protein
MRSAFYRLSRRFHARAGVRAHGDQNGLTLARSHPALRCVLLSTALWAAASTCGCGSHAAEPNPASGGTGGDATGGTGAQAAGGGGAETSGDEAGAGGAPNSEPPADVSGEYVVSLTNGASNCSTVDWTEGQMTTGVMFTIRQNGSTVTAEAGGDAAVYFVLLTGSNQFAGSVHGNAFTLIDHGPAVSQSGNCTYTLDAIVAGTLEGDTITGTLTYSPVVSDDPACAQYACAAVQDYTGVRPSGG